MREIGRLLIVWALGIAILQYFNYGPNIVWADTGNVNATRVAVGSTTLTAVTALDATTVTDINSFRLDRPELTCFNNSPVAIYISSSGATAAHLQNAGFIVLSSATFKLGAHMGAVGALTTSGAGEVRCWSGITQ